ncbi:helix-turn-helix transcriptional regulator [Candidatus Nitrospira nitrificans]|uniref:Helix-turn-helix domain-containing protein n=1 Tax=Candidatus Nitrospira nitrificans TaxID=1742973 RepID=A0A0S4LF64_9BACT|nr:helix-turn-helix domain-containing protein [Candidatus Nitrospira nitrificans]CUS35855.1 hypothetical protein COMA2_20480 [Candidatus Nitrospira nitrificans]
MNAISTLQHKRLLRVDEAAKILNVSRWTVYRWVEAGRLGGTRLGAGSLRIFSNTVSALIDLHCVGATQDGSLAAPAHIAVDHSKVGERCRQSTSMPCVDDVSLTLLSLWE